MIVDYRMRSFILCIFMDQDRKTKTKTKLGRYSAILISFLVNNAYRCIEMFSKSVILFIVTLQTLLQHCYNGTNFFTGDRGVRLDFVSFHIKGQGHSMTILHDEYVTQEEMAQRFPKYKNVPVYNDEGDPLVGWSKTEDWRADATYAAIVVKVRKLDISYRLL